MQRNDDVTKQSFNSDEEYFLEKIYSDICCSDADCEDRLYYATFESSFFCNSFFIL